MDNTKPIGALIEINGLAAWTASNPAELEQLRALVDKLSERRVAAGLTPILAVTDETTTHDKPALSAALVNGTFDDDAVLWTVNLKDGAAMDAAFEAGLPGLGELSGRRFVTPHITDEIIIGVFADGTPATIDLGAASIAAELKDTVEKHQDPQALDDDADLRLVWLDTDGDLYIGRIDDLVKHLEVVGFGAPDVGNVYAPVGGELVHATWRTESSGTSNDWMLFTLTVTVPGHGSMCAKGRIDGRT